MYSLFLPENRTIEIEQFLLKLLRMGIWSRRRMMERVSLTKVCCKHIYECYSKKNPVQLIKCSQKEKEHINLYCFIVPWLEII
jgi:hypothetical protein